MEDQGRERAVARGLVGNDRELHGLAIDGDRHHRAFLRCRRRGAKKKGEKKKAYSAATISGDGAGAGRVTRWVTMRWCRARTVSLPLVRHIHGKRPCTKQPRLPSSMRPPKLKATPRCWK